VNSLEEEGIMSHSQDRGKEKKKKKEPKQDKKRKGLPPHLQRTKEQHGSVREIQKHLDDLAERQQ
jgi:hypothetical protein